MTNDPAWKRVFWTIAAYVYAYPFWLSDIFDNSIPPRRRLWLAVLLIGVPIAFVAIVLAVIAVLVRSIRA